MRTRGYFIVASDTKSLSSRDVIKIGGQPQMYKAYVKATPCYVEPTLPVVF
jgi:hypothetical protein